MKCAYPTTWLYNLEVIKEAKRWLKAGFIDGPQFKTIAEAHASPFYHPNFTIRALIFIASLIGLSGVTGLLALMVLDTSPSVVSVVCLLYGLGSFILVDKAIIRNSKHYKSGLTEALIYHVCGFVIGGLAGLVDFKTVPMLLFALVVLSITAFRYLDLLATVAALLVFSYLIFHWLFSWGGVFQQVIPFVFILVFIAVYLLAKKFKRNMELSVWANNLLLVESFSLLVVYLSGNYLVVRELSINMMGLSLAPGEDIPFAFVFYGFTAIIPAIYLYLGIRNKDAVPMRIGLLVVALSLFTIKYYIGFDQMETTLTVLGAGLLATGLLLFNYLKVMRHGITREVLLSQKWAGANAEAFIVSQTMGGNQANIDEAFRGKGGDFGGGGSSGSF